MRKAAFAPFLAAVLLFSCSGAPRGAGDQDLVLNAPETGTAATNEALLTETKAQEAAEEDCVFNNDIKGLTTQAILQYSDSLTFRWLEEREEALIVLDQDTLLLSMGGCSHFAYSSTYISQHKSIEDTAFWFSKARWIARTFINQEAFLKLKQKPEKKITGAGTVHYEFPADTALTNFFFNGLILQSKGKRGRMRMEAYYN